MSRPDEELLLKFMTAEYTHGGRTLEEGLDCWGLIMMWYRMKLGIELWDLDKPYSPEWSKEGNNFFIENYHMEWVKVNFGIIDDVILFKNKNEVCNHAGIVISNHRFIHACKAGIIISRILDPQWTKKIQGYYRYVGQNKDNSKHTK